MNCYKSLSTLFYDTDKPIAPADDLAFYRGYAERCGGAILEPMCGSGRFLVPLAKAGFDIDGFDASPQMLAACDAKLKTLGIAPRVAHALLHEFMAEREYALAFIPAGSFSLVTDQTQALLGLERLRDSLSPGGTLVFEVERPTMNASSRWPWAGRWLTLGDGSKLLISWLGHYDASTRTSHSVLKYELLRDARLIDAEYEDFDLRLYEPEEIEALAREVGFDSIRTFRKSDGERVASTDSEFVVECRRPR